MMGYSEDELRNLTYNDITPEKWHASEQIILTEQILARGYSDPYEKELIRKDGTIFPVELRAYLIKDAKGNNTGMRAVVRNITERKQAEEALRNEKEFTETALNAQQDSFFLFEPATKRAIRWNRAFNDITGYTDEEISWMPAPDSYYGPEDLKRAAIFVKKVLETGVGKIELELICKDGRKVSTEYNVAVVKDEAGSPRYIISIGRDITERKTALKLLEISENKYRTLLKNIPQKIFYKDINSVYMLCNESYAKDLNIEPSEIIRKTDYDYYPKELAEKYRIDDKKIMDSGKISEIEEQYVVDGKEITVKTLKAPILDDMGKTIGIFGIFWDITERKEAEEELQKAHDELELRVRQRTLELQEKNIAIKVLLKQREEEKIELEQNILSNIKSLIQPYIRKLKRNNSNVQDITYLNVIESNLEDIISPFSQKLSSNYMRFSSKEIEIANLIKEGKKDKEIMEIMNIAFDTIKTHRKNIRKKLGIHGQGTNLRNKLLSM
jgi:PAS domain S-box-containing protein